MRYIWHVCLRLAACRSRSAFVLRQCEDDDGTRGATLQNQPLAACVSARTYAVQPRRCKVVPWYNKVLDSLCVVVVQRRGTRYLGRACDLRYARTGLSVLACGKRRGGQGGAQPPVNLGLLD